jgi:hypothetical protein
MQSTLIKCTGNFGKSILLYWVFTVTFKVNHAGAKTNRSFTGYSLLKACAILATCFPFSRKALLRVSILYGHILVQYAENSGTSLQLKHNVFIFYFAPNLSFNIFPLLFILFILCGNLDKGYV